MSVLLYRFLIIQVSDYTSVTVWLIQTFLIVLYIVLHCISVKWIPTFLDTVGFCTLSVVLLSTLYEYPPSWTLSVSPHWPAAIRPAFWTSDVCTPRWFLCWTPRAPPSPSGRPHPPPLPAWPSPWKRVKNSSENWEISYLSV